MSHVTTGSVCVTDLEDVEDALAKFPGAELRRNQTKFEWFGKFLNDWDNDRAAVNRGYDPETFGQCEHAIHVDGVDYEIGLCKRADGEEGWELIYDTYSSGQQLESLFGGPGLPRLQMEVGANAAERVYSGLGYATERVEHDDGRLEVLLTR